MENNNKHLDDTNIDNAESIYEDIITGIDTPENEGENNPKLKKIFDFYSKKKPPIKIKLISAIFTILLAILVTFMSTFVLLDSKYRQEYNSLLSDISGDTYYTLDYVKALFAKNYIGDLSELDESEILDALINTYIAQTGDDYAYYWDKEDYLAYINEFNGDSVGIGVIVNYDQENKAINILYVYEDSPAEKAGVVPGDSIVKVEGRSVADIGYDSAVSLIKGEVGTSLTVTVSNDAGEKDVSLTRQEITTVSVTSKVLSDGKTGYIRILQFDATTTEQFAKAYLSLKEENSVEHFVFDVRDNPGGGLDSVLGVLSFLVGDEVPLIEISDVSKAVITKNSNRELYCQDKYSNSVAKSFKHTGKTVILTNSNTASAGELFTACMHEYSDEIITVGTTTYGKGVMQRTYALPNGGALKLTYASYTASGVENYNGVGLIPDVEQELDGDAAGKNIFTLSEEDDTQLQRAFKVLYGETLE